jgi:hypothetical protein
MEAMPSQRPVQVAEVALLSLNAQLADKTPNFFQGIKFYTSVINVKINYVTILHNMNHEMHKHIVNILIHSIFRALIIFLKL